MKKQTILILALIMTSLQIFAQNRKQAESGYFSYHEPIKKEKYKIAVLTPLYLDSIDLEKNLTKIPNFMMPGIDFYQGVRIAADTLGKQGIKLDLYIYDSKSNYLNVEKIVQSDRLDSMDLIIGNASVSDLGLLANYAKNHHVNFISAVSPSDANQIDNPFFTILQPRLQTHIEKIHAYINRKFASDNIIFITDESNSSKNALNYFKNDPLNNLPGRYREVTIHNQEFNIQEISSKIDSNYNTTIVLATLEAGTTYKILKQMLPLTDKYNVKVFCMPTAEAISSLGKENEFPGLPIYYTTSYIIDKVTPASMYIGREYKKLMGSAPSEVVYKGFESLWFFTKLLTKYGVPFNDNISDNTYSFITPYKIMPVKRKSEFYFFENKFLFLIKYDNGVPFYE
ncbi:MAG: hypothetical protein IT215_00730 [Chitinophagaceae bacterium]|nr:MAG: branched-chain amino acid ABC transporter periplasmic protein [Bacteroidetes bacterium OLB11]MCC6447195.1 hypothetical protein [Chitinophagaceae bacterium]HMN32703.1 hypothetical protein [Chitinophagaceae bacterium]